MLVSLSSNQDKSKIQFHGNYLRSLGLERLSSYEKELFLRKDYFAKKAAQKKLRAARILHDLSGRGVQEKNIVPLSLSERIILSLSKKRVAALKAAESTAPKTT